MEPQRRILYILGVCLFFLFLFWYFRVPKEKFQPEENPWYEKTIEEFFNRFQRDLDPIHVRYFDTHCKYQSLQKNIQWIQKDLEKYQQEVLLGEKASKNSSIIIAGLIRNGAFQIAELKQRCSGIISHFKSYKIIIVENNSTDNTRDFLLEWVKEDPNVILLCQDIFSVNHTECDISNLFPKSENLGASPLPARIQKMSFLRNIYLKHIQHYYSDYDYLCVMDMDLKGNLYLDGFLQSFFLLSSSKNIDAIACNGVIQNSEDHFYYYDSFAHIELGDPYVWENQTAKSNHDKYVHTHITLKYSTKMNLDRVRSAFGGVVLYKMDKIKNASYDFSPNFFSCEHSYFHKNLTIMVNPRFIFIISQNGN